MKRSDKFGINMKQWCREHEAYLAAHDASPELLALHLQKLGWLPEAQNDMIFPIIIEELGIFGGLIVLILYLYLLYRLMFIAQNAPDEYGTLMVTGVFAHVAVQVIFNICVVLNLIPATGVTLPFISYGGTSVFFLMMEIAIALSVSRRIYLGRDIEKPRDLWGDVVETGD